MKWYRQGLSFALFILLSLSLFSQTISGRVSGEMGQPLPFSSILIKGTTTGVSANADGDYTLAVQPGRYTLVAQHVGYISTELDVTVNSGTVTINFNLPLQQYNLNNVTVKAGGKDQAYEIIRNAIKKRPQYEHEIQKLQCDVYIKGRLQLESFPKRMLGQKVELPSQDTMQNQTLFLSETIARWSVEEPNKEKVEVLSTRVSGNSNGYGLGSPQIISFYHNNIKIGDNLNPRGFISPIANNALNAYNYKLDGTFYDNGLLINHIRVIPKRKYEPVFAGYINIIEGSWRIYSVELSVQKDQQMQYLDLLKIDQIYVQVDSNWLVKQQVIYPSFNLLGFAGYGNFVQVYSHFNLQPQFAKNFFNHVIITYPDSATKKPVSYWDSTRPVPLQEVEIADYKRRDSLETIRSSRAYLDSVDKARNKPKLIPLLVFGQDFTNTKSKTDVFFDPLIYTVSYNTVEGANIIFSPNFTKRWTTDRQSLFISPTVRYGFNNHHFNSHLTGIFTYGKKYRTSLYLSGGRRVFQVNNDQPITVFNNAISTLFYTSNYMKIYEAPFWRTSFTKELPGGFAVTAYAEYQDRHPLENTTDWVITKSKGRTLSPNYPEGFPAGNFPAHQALVASLALKWQPGARYVSFPDRFVNMGSSYPTITATFIQGVHNTLGSDINYNKWRLNVSDNIDLHLGGRFAYNITAGGFFNKAQLFAPDYQHYYGNRSALATDYLQGFQLAEYYNLSNAANFYTEAHAEYHLNGLLTNQIPLLKKWNWFFVAGSNALFYKDRQYVEYYFSIENILKLLRIDFVQSYNPQGGNTSGIRFSVSGLQANYKED